MDPQNKGKKLAGIPRGCVISLGGTNSYERNYLLCKDGQTIVIQAPGFCTKEERKYNVYFSPENLARRQAHMETLRKQWLYGLECIHAILHTVEFGKTNWGYFVTDKHGGNHIIQKQRPMRKVVFHTWAPLIDENEITYTKYWEAGHRAGYWRGHYAEIFIGYDDVSRMTVERHMHGHWLIKDMDLSYEVLGHIINNDGEIYGLVVAAETGRLPLYRDKALVYEALSRLQKHGIVFASQLCYWITIKDGKVRLTNLPTLRRCEDPKELERLADHYHWQQLEQMFGRDSLDPNDFVPRPHLWQKLETAPLLTMAPFDGLERPIPLVYFGFFCNKKKGYPLPECEVDAEDRMPRNRRRRLLTASQRRPTDKTMSTRGIVETQTHNHRQPILYPTSRQTAVSKVLLPNFSDPSSSSDDVEEIYSPETNMGHSRKERGVWIAPDDLDD